MADIRHAICNCKCVPATICASQDPSAPSLCVREDGLPGSTTVFEYQGVCYSINPADTPENACDTDKSIDNLDGLTTHANCAACVPPGTICDNCTYGLPPKLQFVVSGVDPLFSCMPCDDTFSALTSDDESNTSVDGTYTFTTSACGESFDMGIAGERRFCCETSAPECNCLPQDLNYEVNATAPALQLTTRQTSGPNSGQMRCRIFLGPTTSHLAFDSWVTVGVNDCYNSVVWTNQIAALYCGNFFPGCAIDQVDASTTGTVTMTAVYS